MLMNLVFLIAGFILAILFWFFTNIVLRPKIKIDPNILKINKEVGPPEYKIKIKNLRKSDVFDIKVFFTIYYKKNLPSFSINLCDGGIIPFLGKKGRKIEEEKNEEEKSERYLQIYAKNSLRYREKNFPDESIIKKIENYQLTLDDLLDLSEFKEACLTLIATDKFTGARNCFQERYNRDSIKPAKIINDPAELVVIDADKVPTL